LLPLDKNPLDNPFLPSFSPSGSLSQLVGRDLPSDFVQSSWQKPMNGLMFYAPHTPCHRDHRSGKTPRRRPVGRCDWAACLLLLAVAFNGCTTLARSKTDESVVSARQLSLRGINAAQQGQFQEAQVFFNRASEMCPLDEKIRYHYAETLWQLGSRTQAVAHMEEAVRLSGGNADLVVRLGDMYLAGGDLQRAAVQADAAIQANRQLASAWALRGDVLRSMGQDEEALASYHRALSNQSHYPHVQLAVADIYGRQRRHARALATLRTLADGYPSGETPTQVLVLQGLALKELGRYEAAAETLASAAKQQKPPSTEVLAYLAETQWLAGDAANARLTLQTALSQSSQEQAAEPLMAQLLTLQQKLTGDMRL